ncbi:MAG: SRPBCC family protein [Anaerolineales bacterium]|nr:SRPBCC family protein [Anaerolineales bacterium]
MIHLNISTLIHQPVKQVFDFMSNPENDFQWQYGTLSSNKLSKASLSSGSLFRSVGHLMGQRALNTFKVTEFEENKKYSFKSLSGTLNSQTTYTFEIDNESTKVNLTTQVNAINSIDVNEGALEKKIEQQLKENLILLKKVLEEKMVEQVLAI